VGSYLHALEALELECYLQPSVLMTRCFFHYLLIARIPPNGSSGPFHLPGCQKLLVSSSEVLNASGAWIDRITLFDCKAIDYPRVHNIGDTKAPIASRM
jgi:hypothetical protein